MRWFIIYLIITVILNVFAGVYQKGVDYLHRNLVKGIIVISLPVSRGLLDIQNVINNYLILVSVQKENERMRQDLAKCRIVNKLLREKLETKSPSTFRLTESPFSFKGYFQNDYIYLSPTKGLDLKKNYCFVLSSNLSLIGMVERKEKNIYVAETVFNPKLVADVFILSNGNKIYRALFMGNKYIPRVEFLDPNVDVKVGDKVYTSGDFGIYPPGIYIGSISSVKNVYGYYKMAYVDISKGFFNSWKVFLLCKKR